LVIHTDKSVHAVWMVDCFVRSILCNCVYMQEIWILSDLGFFKVVLWINFKISGKQLILETQSFGLWLDSTNIYSGIHVWLHWMFVTFRNHLPY